MWNQYKIILCLICSAIGLVYLFIKSYRRCTPRERIKGLAGSIGIMLLLDAIVPVHTFGKYQHGYLTFIEKIAGLPRPTEWIRPLELALGIALLVLVAILSIKDRIKKKAQQGGPAYPPQGVGSADP
jgi:hypothetical protein